MYAHELAAAALRDQPERLRREAYEEVREEHPALAAELADTALLAPTHTVHTETVLDVGGRQVLLRHPGRGHTDADLVVHVPDADVLVAGDLVEQSGPPAFEDSYPLQWPDAVADLLRLTTPRTVVVPGHGDPVDVEFVRAQHAELAQLAWLIRAAHTGGAPPERVAAEAPFGARPALIAARRGYAELDGTDLDPARPSRADRAVSAGQRPRTAANRGPKVQDRRGVGATGRGQAGKRWVTLGAGGHGDGAARGLADQAGHPQGEGDPLAASRPGRRVRRRRAGRR